MGSSQLLENKDNLILAKVSGDSMLPLYLDGEILIVDTAAYDHAMPQIKDDVIFSHPYQLDTYVLKRIVNITADSRYDMRGLNPTASTDSRSFGTISLQQIIGKVIGKQTK